MSYQSKARARERLKKWTRRRERRERLLRAAHVEYRRQVQKWAWDRWLWGSIVPVPPVPRLEDFLKGFR